MRAKAFDTLVTSIRQAGAIRRGARRPSRVFRFKREDVRAIRRISASHRPSWPS